MTDETEQHADAGRDRYMVPALRRGLAILGLFSGRSVVTVPDITRAHAISRATAFRLVCTLEEAGFLERVPNAHAFRLGHQSLAISFDYLNSLDVVDVARPLLEQLRDKVGATAHLGIRHGTVMMYLLRAASQHELVSSIVVPVGTRYPVHAVSCGRALLFDLSDVELDALFANFEFDAYAAPAPPSLAALKALLEEERQKGYVYCSSAFVRAKRSIGAPVRDGRGTAIAAINVSDASFLIKDPDGAVKDAVLAAAAAISGRLGYRPASVQQTKPRRSAGADRNRPLQPARIAVDA